MSTGSLAVLLGQTPYRFSGLDTIGKVFFILDIVLLLSFLGLLLTRFALRPAVVKGSLRYPPEALFFGSFWVSVSLLLTNIAIYGVPSAGRWLVDALEICFWIYSALAFLVTVFQYSTIFVASKLPVKSAMPAWIFPAYPLLIIGPLAGVLLPDRPPSSAIPMFLGAVMLQGLGWTISVFMYTIYLQRLMSSNLPPPPTRPGMYVSVGPVAYTSVALISLGSQAPTILPNTLISGNLAVGDTVKILGFISGVFLWAVSFWFFSVSTFAVLQGVRKMSFTLNWWAFIFPNAGMTLALIQIGKSLDNSAIKWICSAMTIILTATWFVVAIANIRAVYKKQILWEGMDEDDGMELPMTKVKDEKD